MAKPTPLPWEADGALVTARGGMDVVADCDRLNGLGLEESEANARLVAHLSRFPEALRDLIGACHEGGGCRVCGSQVDPNADEPGGQTGHEEGCDVARAQAMLDAAGVP